MKKKKTFQSESLRRLVLLERLVWLIPIGFFLWNLWVFRELFGRMMVSEHPLAAGIIIVGVCVTAAFVRGVVPFLVLKALLYCAKKQMIQNNTFQTVSDFEYYRDKLEGLSPGAISLISDLKIEQKKDVAASILKYKEMGVLKEIDGRYVAENLEQAQLRESDTYLINGLVNNTFSVETDGQWRHLVEEETIKDGYIAKIGSWGQKKGCSGCAITLLFQIVLFIVAFWLCFRVMDGSSGFQQILDRAIESENDEELLNYICGYPQYYPMLAQMFFALILLVIALFSPLAVVAGVVGTALNMKMIRRTAHGNEMAECIYGMKNFIHDYSNLSQADQEQVVLWDDYLIYAVVLEENQQIVAEIMERRKKV